MVYENYTRVQVVADVFSMRTGNYENVVDRSTFFNPPPGWSAEHVCGFLEEHGFTQIDIEED